MTTKIDEDRVGSGRDPAAQAAATAGEHASRRATRIALLDRRGVRILLGFALPLLVLVVWQYQAGQDSNTLGFLATPAQVVQTFVELARNGTLLESVGASLSRILGGVGIAVAVGVPAGILVGTSRFVEAVLWPFVELVRQVPIPAWVPFMVLFLGIGNRPAILLIALASFFPIFLNTVSGVRQIPAIHLRAGRMLGANRFQMLTRVVLPSALPTVLTGIRVGTGIGVMVVVLAELIAVRSGVGYLILLGQVQFQGDYVITGMITISILGWLLSKVIGGVERIVMRHRMA